MGIKWKQRLISIKGSLIKLVLPNSTKEFKNEGGGLSVNSSPSIPRVRVEEKNLKDQRPQLQLKFTRHKGGT